jgi:hypothetical protein
MLDVSVYCTAGTSLDSFLQIWVQELRKVPFPRSYLVRLENLREKNFPPTEVFRGLMSRKSISESLYKMCRKFGQNKVWKLCRTI